MKKNSVRPEGNSLPRQKTSHPRDKYFLRDLHQEIDLYDRRLAHLDNHAEFASASERDEARAKLVAKRAALEKAARELAAEGVEFSNQDLPRSFSTNGLHETRAS